MIELSILDFIQKIHSPFLDWLMLFFTHLGDKGIIWIVIIACLLVNKRTRKIGVIMSVSMVINLVVCNLFLKNIFLRSRPFTYNPNITLLIPKPLDYSFPSGHTSASFACIMCLYLAKDKKLFFMSLIIGVLIAFSRMYLYVHFPTDIIGGIVVGIFSAYLGSYIINSLQKTSQEG